VADQLVFLTEETLPAIMAAMPHPAYVVNAADTIVAMNEAARASLPPSVPSGSTNLAIAECFSTSCRDAVARALTEAAKLARPIFFHGEGAIHAGLFAVYPLVGEGGKVGLLALFTFPANGAHRSERELRESEERYRKLVELLPDAIMVHSEGTVEYINAAGVRLWGGDATQAFEGMSHMDLLHPDDRAFVRERIHQIERGDRSPLREYRILRLDGGVVPVEAAGTLITYRGKPANLVMFRDITARKEAEARLKETISRYRSLFEDSPISLWEEDWSGFRQHLDALRASGVTDFASYLDGDPQALSYCFSLLRLKDANRACVEFYGARDKTELIAHMETLFPEESVIIRDGLNDMAEGRRLVVSEGLTHTLAGEERHVIYHFSVSPGCEDTWDKVIVSVIDLTAQKQIERRLMEVNARLEKEEAQRRLLSQSLMEISENDRRGVAMELHDHFGQMMTTLKLNLEILAAGLEGADPLLLARLDEATAKATQTITDLKKFASGLMPSMIETLGLIPSLQALIDDVRGSASLEVQFFSSGISGRFDREKELALYRIAQESINNVVKHAHARTVHVNLISNGGSASLSIEDDGVGFAYSEEAYMLWRGGPLGLHIMRERAVQFGGELTIDSRPGQGVHVLAEIPL
jgi:PAS domain S-box-containing protein